MIREIYIRNESDPNFVQGVIDYQDEVESIITQIRMIIGTAPGDVFGSPEFGLDLEDYVFRTKYGAAEINEKLEEQIKTYLKHSDSISVRTNLRFGDSGKGWDYALLDIYINGQKTLGFLIDKEDKDEA